VAYFLCHPVYRPYFKLFFKRTKLLQSMCAIVLPSDLCRPIHSRTVSNYLNKSTVHSILCTKIRHCCDMLAGTTHNWRQNRDFATSKTI